MAETVLDIVQRINYEADTTAIEIINDEFGDQLELINKSQQKIDKYSAALKNLSADQQRQATIYTGLIAREQAGIDKLTTSIGQQIGANKKLSNTVVDLSGKMKNLSFAGSQLVREAPAFAYSLQTGLIGISNNIPILIDQLKAARAAGASTTDIFKSLGGSVFGLVGIISVAIPLLVQFGGKLFDTGEDAKKAAEDYDKFIESLRNNALGAAKATDEQTNRIKLLVGVMQSTTANVNQQAAAYKELQDLYPSQLENVKQEAFLQSGIVEQINKQVAAKENAAAFSKSAVENQQKEAAAIKKVEDAQTALNKSREPLKSNFLSPAAVTQALKVYNAANAALVVAQRELANNQAATTDLQRQALLQTLEAGALAIGGGKTDKPKKGEDPYKLAIEAAETSRERAEHTSDILKLLREAEISINETYAQLYQLDQAEKREISQEERAGREQGYERKQKEINTTQEIVLNDLNASLLKQKIQIAKAFNEAKDLEKFRNELDELSVKRSKLVLDLEKNQQAGAFFNDNGNPFKDRPLPDALPVQDNNIQKHNDKRAKAEKDLRDITISSAKLTRDILIQFADDVFTHQAELLDREIALRQRNLEIGLELLKRGNSEVLKQEQERLDEAQKKRDEVGQKQIALNAALQASSIALTTVQTLQAIANAATLGDPYTAPIRIAATIAAITAGFASMIALGKSLGQGFSEGGYTGDGGKYEPKGVVHGGEYVINKEQTARHRGVLEAINKGQYPALVGAYGKTTVNQPLDRTDDLIDAIHSNKLHQDIRFDENGIAIMTRKLIRRDRNRFR